MLRNIAISTPRPTLLLCIAMICSCACSARVSATEVAPGGVIPADAVAQTPLHFDIPAQPLQSALEAYGAFTDVSLLYDSSLTAGRVSPPVQGDMTARAALPILLEGSGLTPRYTGAKTVALVPVRRNAPDVADDTSAAAATARRYFGLVQTRVRDAFCAQPVLAQGARRIALRLWIDATGQIGPVSLLGSSGDASIDKLVVTSLQGVRIGEAVPPSLAQPFTFVILPKASGRSWGCEPANDARPATGGLNGR
ncbi:TonB-dependent outer membrane receptor [Pandoraea apista]|uniref:TonB-dependent outer membrane receptor n=2 Tax=Pandoraea apista TaxID=93218 RepID=A0ABX9ZJ11_9BURK|nr:TonB-dependent outer membrane receptor [Pandoraea apista]RRJ34250.1 TonB-dependent outer membrane receptor [Pandoraea apista]RRJ80516.1 TonB-dependent outer membrane receptor [Pandoraea apista]RRW92325.1 TonB-dependent outer membrane receptor [Pandoraea apista]RRX01791.1 TonB-dependent outer membrane receptor [Pandoraea apista]